MEIYITRNIRIVNAGAGYAIEHRVLGKAAWKTEGYYGRLEHAAQGVVACAVHGEVVTTNAKLLVEALKRTAEVVARYARAVEASHPHEPVAPPFPELTK